MKGLGKCQDWPNYDEEKGREYGSEIGLTETIRYKTYRV
jgi:hypothetical protein